MRILYVCHYFPPFSIGGTEEYTLDLAHDMQRRGHAVHVFHGIIGERFAEHEIVPHEIEGVPCTGVEVDLSLIDDFSGTWRQPEIERIFADLLARERFDVAHVQHLTRLSLGILDVLRARGIPIVMTVHDYWQQCARGQRMRLDGELCPVIDDERCAACMAIDVDFVDVRRTGLRKLALVGRRGTAARHLAQVRRRRAEMRAALAVPDLVLVPGEFLAASYREWGLGRTLHVERIGVDPSLAGTDDGTRSTPRSDAALRLGFLGRVIPTKGIETVIDALRTLERAPGFDVHGRGADDYVDALRRRADGLDVRFSGRFGPADLPRLYAGFDVQIVPSIGFEGGPLVVQKARLFQKPLIVSDTGGMTELVRDGVDGLVFSAGDVGRLRTQLVRLMQEPALVTRMRAALPPPLLAREHFDAVCAHYERLTAR